MREKITEDLTQYLEAAGMKDAGKALAALTDDEILQLRETLPLPEDTVGQGIGMSDTVKAVLEDCAGLSIDKEYRDASWILKKAVEIASDVMDVAAFCLSDGGELLIITGGQSGFVHCCTNVQMIQGYWDDPDPEIQAIIGDLTKWKYFDEHCDEFDEYEPDDSLSDEENYRLADRLYEKQERRAERERVKFLKRFAERFNAALDERFGSDAPGMIEYMRA